MPTKVLCLEIWPHRSLSFGGFRWVMMLSIAGFALPLGALIGGQAFWIIGAFCLAALLLLYGLIQLTYRSGRLHETLEIWPDLLRVQRFEANGQKKIWEANPHWVRVELYDTKQIESYLVLSASGRAVELGAFLTPEERRELAQAVRQGIAKAAQAAL